MRHPAVVVFASLVVFLIGLSLLDFSIARAGAAEEPSTPPTETSHENAEAPVLKVFSAEEGGRRYVAYLVEWKGQEVVVTDPLCRSSHKKGDSITFMAHMGRRLGGRNGEEKVAPLSFILLDRPPRLQLSKDEEQRRRRLAQGDLDAAANDEERFDALGVAGVNAPHPVARVEPTARPRRTRPVARRAQVFRTRLSPGA